MAAMHVGPLGCLGATEVVVMPKIFLEPLLQPRIRVSGKHLSDEPTPKVPRHGLQPVSKPGNVKPLDIDYALSFGAPG